MSGVQLARLIAALVATTAASIAFAQGPVPPAPRAAGGVAAAPAPRPTVYPPRPVDPAGVERGRALYSQNGCAGCHGGDTRGGAGGPPLHRRALVLNDVRGEKIGPVLAVGLAGVPGHRFSFEPSQIVDIADFLHSMRTIGTGNSNIVERVPTILTGSPNAGKAYFDKACASCHSATGDLARIGSRVSEPRQLQQRWLAPLATKPVMATIALPNGDVTGEVTALDEFSVTLKTAAGERVIERNGPRPRVAINDPLEAHAAMLRRLADKDIHDVTAYLVTLK